MAFADLVLRSTEKHRVLAEVDIAVPNTQWQNSGAGIWYVNALGLYPEWDDSLLNAFTAQGFGAIGSVRVDGAPLTRVSSRLLVTSTATSFYYDTAARELFVRLENYDEPSLHVVNIGVIYGYCAQGFSPTGGPGLYEGRLTRNPTVSKTRDPLFYGRLVFRSGSINLINSDGEFDAFGRDKDIYGNEARVKIGFDSIDYSDYKTVFTGYVDNFSVSEVDATFTISDKRRQLTKPVTRTDTNANALDTIADILNDAYGYSYDARFFDLTSWAAARSALPSARANITLNMQEPEPVIDVIEDIATSVFGLFFVTPDGKFSFKIVDTEPAPVAIIQAHDILNAHSLTYNPSEVVSSVRVGYNRNWTTSGTQYTYVGATSSTVFAQYKTYNERKIDTLLPTLTAASAYATVVLNYTDTVRSVETITVPLEHYARALGDMVGVVIQRGDQSMLGDRKAEVIGVEIAMDSPVVNLTIRDIGALEAFRQTEAGAIRQTEAGEIRMVCYWQHTRR